MTELESQVLAPIADEAVRCSNTQLSNSDYSYSYLLPRESLKHENEKLFPVSIAGRFAVDGSGIYSGSADVDPEMAEQFHPSDIEACARAGQYFLPEFRSAFPVQTGEAEEFIFNQQPISSRNNIKLKLLTGIEVMYSQERKELVPLLIFHRKLGDIVYPKREEIAGMLLDRDKSYNELLIEAGDSSDRYKSFFYPNDAISEHMGETVARALMLGCSIHY